ncbi:MAG: hypothetical protein KAT00_15150, partial [Planctomycetes bacterium]|nr:hypothetical protein [Planctomycetota bacterium]
GIEGVKEDDLDIRFRNVEEWKIEGPCTTLNLVTGGKYVYQVEETKKLGGQTPFKRSNTIIRGTYSSKEKAIASVDCTKLTGQADGSFLDNPLFLGKRELEFKLGDATLRTTFSFFVVKHAVR